MSERSVAVLGCGYWGQNLVRNFHQLGALKLVCDPAESARLRVGAIAPGVETLDTYETVFARDDIKAVVLATPAETHHPLTMLALSAGKDVFVEKPLALNHSDGLAMRAEAERVGRILMVGHLLDYHPAVLKLRRLVADRVLGRVNYIYSNRLNFGKIRTLRIDLAPDWRVTHRSHLQRRKLHNAKPRRRHDFLPPFPNRCSCPHLRQLAQSLQRTEARGRG